MNLLFKIERDKHLDLSLPSIVRRASRGIIFINNQLLMVQSKLYKEFKFPGGGIKPNESFVDGMKREVAEETGYFNIYDIEEFGYTVEYRKAHDPGFEAFVLESYYYTCKCTYEKTLPNLDPYEQEYGYEAVLVSIEDAITQNKQLLGNPNIPWVERETKVLEYLLKKANE